MFFRLFLLFTLIPLAELFILLQLGKVMGLLPTLYLVLFTGALGAWLARGQGLATWTKIRHSQARGELPAEALVDGLLILIAGAVLLTPGLLTDIAGFFLLIPGGRRIIRRAVRQRFEKSLKRRRGPTGPVIIIDPSNDPPG